MSFLYVTNRGNRWIAKMVVEQKQIYIGCYATEIEAARAADDYIRKNSLIKKVNFPN